jgi:hypothetical protein
MVLTSYHLRVRLLPALLLALIAGLALASAAGATCYSSTPATATLSDSPFDGDSGLSPEITTVTATISAACGYAVNPGITQPLISDDAVFEYLDLDGNPATGSQVFVGADAIVGSVGAIGPDPAPILGRWDPAANSFSFVNAPSLTPLGIGGFSASIDQLGIATSPLTSTVQVGAIWIGVYDSYFDFAPEPGAGPLPLPVAFSTVAPPPPPPPPAPAPVVVPVAAPAPAPVTSPAPVTATAKACTVPSLKRLRTAAAKTAIRHAGCKVGLTRRAYSSTIASGRVITSSPKAGATWNEPVDLVVSRGRKPKKRHKAHRASTADVRGLLEIAARQLDAQR